MKKTSGSSTHFLLPSDYCVKNGYHSRNGKLIFSRTSKEYFAVTYCKSDWDIVDKVRLHNVMTRLFNNFNNFDKNGLPIFRTTEKPQLVDLYPDGI